jgi:hypothetical protein
MALLAFYGMQVYAYIRTVLTLFGVQKAQIYSHAIDAPSAAAYIPF